MDELDAKLKTCFERVGQVTTYQAGEVVYYQGEITSSVGFIISGAVRATSFSEHGNETWLGRFTEGDLIGHSSILSGEALRYEAAAEIELSLIFISPETLKELLNGNSEFGERIAKDLAVKVDAMTMRLIEAYTLSAKGRICAELLRISTPIGMDPDKTLIRPNPVFVELAVRVNSTRETVSRTVSRLQKNGVISREPGAILIHKPAFLKSAIK